MARFRDLEKRVGNLETVVDLVVSEQLDSPNLDWAFNGQDHRKRIFGEILQLSRFDLLVETGTWLGNTTAYMSRMSKLPVISCEIDPRFFACARRRLAKETGVTLYRGTSVELLRELSRSPHADETLFFYLDAHWYATLPLRQELETIATGWSSFAVMIDDFRVPWDSAYGYDVYEGRPLDMEIIEDVIRSRHLAAFFPSLPAVEETGRARGCVVIGTQGRIADALAGAASLRVAPCVNET
jgi:hypothetical protein